MKIVFVIYVNWIKYCILVNYLNFKKFTKNDDIGLVKLEPSILDIEVKIF